MPIRNEGSFLRESLGAVLAQDYPTDRLEILVADGCSTDGTQQLIGAFKQKHPNLELLENSGRIVPTGLNLALRRARGEIILRVDGHTFIAPDYVSQCVAALSRSGAENVGGRMNATGAGRFGEAVAMATSSPFGVGGARFHYSNREEFVDTVYLGAWPRHVFVEIGLFDEELVRNQDDEFNYRLTERGGRILLSPEIKSVYTNRSSPGSLWRQYFQYGYWKVRVLQKHPGQMQPRQFAPPAFVFTLLISIFGYLFSTFDRLSLVVPGLYLLANLVASIYTASYKGWRNLPLLPLAYAILHLSYGAGFLAGLIKFWNRWGDKTGKVPTWRPGPVSAIER